MEEIVNHAQTSTLTEQPSFYIVLCGGQKGAWKEKGDGCIYQGATDREKVYVHFLDRRLFPAGAMFGSRHNKSWPITGAHGPSYWDNPHLKLNNDGLVLLHNNWVRGINRKQERVVERGLWYYNVAKQICSYREDPNAKALIQDKFKM